MRKLSVLNTFYLVVVLGLLSACSPYYQENLYGNGHYPSKDDTSTDSSSETETMDYQAFQSNFMTIDVNQVSYSITDTLSYITLRGTCFNPGFEIASIYYRAIDQQGFDIANDGYPYLTNKVFYSGTTKLQPVSLTCGKNGLWSTVLEVPTAILYQLDKGALEVSIVVWHKGEELHNEGTGLTSVSISPPPLETEPAQ